MSLYDDLANDYAMIEGLETVSVLDVSAAVATTDSSVTALGAGETRVESGDTETIEQYWTIYAKSCSFKPSIDDVLTDAGGVKWTIVGMRTIQIANVDYSYECLTRKQV